MLQDCITWKLVAQLLDGYLRTSVRNKAHSFIPSEWNSPERSIRGIGNDVVAWHNRNHGEIPWSGGTGSGGEMITADMSSRAFSIKDPNFSCQHRRSSTILSGGRSTCRHRNCVGSLGQYFLHASNGVIRLDVAKAASSLRANLLDDSSSHTPVL